MINTIKSKWSDILMFMKDQFELTDLSYKTWLEPLQPYRIVDKNLYIIASDNSNHLIVDIVTKKYKDFLNIAISKVTGIDICPVFILNDDRDKINDMPQSASKKNNEELDFNELLKSKNLNPKYTFYSFVSGKSNELAHAASLAVAENPGSEYKLLYLYGGVGLGKTHLMHAIAIYILKNNNNANVIYTTTEGFTNEYIDAIKKNTTDVFRKKYRSADVLLIDDIQFIANKESTREEFFNTFNTLYGENKQIVITSDKPPRDINNLEDRIRSRFEGGMIVDITPPNFETRMAILRKKEEIEGYNIDDEVLKYIATNIKSNIRTLEGALQRIVLKSKLEKKPVNVETAAQILIDVINVDNKDDKITPERIISVVCEHYNVSESSILSSRKNKDLSFARQIIMYLCCEMTDATLKVIGSSLGGRDHATIIHGRDKITEEIKKNDNLRNDINVLKKKINP